MHDEESDEESVQDQDVIVPPVVNSFVRGTFYQFWGDTYPKGWEAAADQAFSQGKAYRRDLKDGLTQTLALPASDEDLIEYFVGTHLPSAQVKDWLSQVLARLDAKILESEAGK